MITDEQIVKDWNIVKRCENCANRGPTTCTNTGDGHRHECWCKLKGIPGPLYPLYGLGCSKWKLRKWIRDNYEQEKKQMKYKLSEETKEVYGRTLHRIVCVTAFASVSVGDIGGWVESENNLSQNGNAWVCGDAEVFGDAEVCGNAWVYGDAKVYGNAWVCGDAEVFGDAKVYGDAKVFGNAWVYGDAEVCGNAKVYGNAWVCGDAKVYGLTDFMVLKNSWSSGRYFTYTASNKKWNVGCFYGTGDELIAKAYKDSELSGKCYEAAVKYVEEIERFKKEMKNEH